MYKSSERKKKGCTIRIGNNLSEYESKQKLRMGLWQVKEEKKICPSGWHATNGIKIKAT